MENNDISNRLVLLFGLPRSGTTWIGKILDSHPETLYLHEPDSTHRPENEAPLLPSPPWEKGFTKENLQYILQIATSRHPDVLGKKPFFPKNFYPSHIGIGITLAITAAKALQRVNIEIEKVPFTDRGIRNAKSIVWKSIESLGRIRLFREIIPEAKSVHILRHPCGYANSVLRGEQRNKFSSGTPTWDDWGILNELIETSTARKAGLNQRILEKSSPCQRLAWQWRIVNDKALEDCEDIFQHMVLLYEEMCESSEKTSRKLIAHAGLEMSPAVLRFISSSTRKENNDYYSVTKDSKTSAWSWKKNLSNTQKEEIINVVEGSKSWELYKKHRLTSF